MHPRKRAKRVFLAAGGPPSSQVRVEPLPGRNGPVAAEKSVAAGVPASTVLGDCCFEKLTFLSFEPFLPPNTSPTLASNIQEQGGKNSVGG